MLTEYSYSSRVLGNNVEVVDADYYLTDSFYIQKFISPVHYLPAS